MGILGWVGVIVSVMACTGAVAPVSSDADRDGWRADRGDCDDADARVHPGVRERCDGIDEDCDGQVDEDPEDGAVWHRDKDGDGAGDARASIRSCMPGVGWTMDASDCDDTDPRVRPHARERCDGIDEDCDGRIDNSAADAPAWQVDADGDGYGDPSRTVRACDQPSGTTGNASDCDDRRRDVHPGARETCNGRDDDCDGTVDGDDARDAALWYPDDDDDGYGRSERARWACDAPRGHVGRAGDCRDDDPAVHPGATERCNAQDDDCDGLSDEPWGEACRELRCDGSGVVHVVPNECMDDGGGSTSEDSLEVYCLDGIARFCLSGEACPWRDPGWPDDGSTCSTAGLTSAHMANAWCEAWDGHATITCVDGRVGW